jgi:hypothetical protein
MHAIGRVNQGGNNTAHPVPDTANTKIPYCGNPGHLGHTFINRTMEEVALYNVLIKGDINITVFLYPE